MARLDFKPYRATKLLEPGAAGRVSFDKSIGSAVSGLGKALSGAAARAQARQEGLENFKAENDFNAMNQQLAAKSDEMLTNYDGTPGDGFHDDFLENHYKPARDEFMSSLPERLQEKYGILLADDPDEPGRVFTNYSIAAAKAETQIRGKWYDKEIENNSNGLVNEMSRVDRITKDEYHLFRDRGRSLIMSATDMHEGWRAQKLEEWDQLSQTAFVDKLMQEGRAEDVLRFLGGDPRQLIPAARDELLIRSMIQIESSGRPDAVSPAGAVGLMQVMPSTAEEIAGELGDRNFPGDLPQPQRQQAIRQYLSDPEVSRRYGTHYIKKMLRKYDGDLDAALIAYNGGPSRANAWLKAGKNDAAIPEETAEYYKKVRRAMGQLPSYDADGKPVWDEDFNMSPDKATSILLKHLEPNKKNMTSHVVDLDPQFKAPLAALIEAAPPDIRKGLQIGSGFRSHEHQQRLWNDALKKYGSAAAARKWVAPPGHSNHNHGVAADLWYNGTRLDKAPARVRNWVHNNAEKFGLHFRMDWEPWHIELKHGSKRVAIPHKQQQSYYAAAQKALLSSASSLTPVEKVRIKNEMDRELLQYRLTGEGSDDFNEEVIAQRLGEEDYLKWDEKRKTNTAMYMAEDRVKGLLPGEMSDYLDSLKPSPDSPTLERDQRVFAAAEKEVKRVEKLRKDKPAEAALELPELDAQRRALEQTRQPRPDDVQRFISEVMERQKEFAVPTADMQPIPESWALRLGAFLTDTIPAIQDITAENRTQVFRTRVAAVYQQLEQVYGPYTDEVINQAVSTYLGMDRDQADMVTALMGMVNRKEWSAAEFMEYAQRGNKIAEEELGNDGGWSLFDLFRGGDAAEKARRESAAEAE